MKTVIVSKKKIIITSVILVILITLAALLFFIHRAGRLDRALKDMDINDKESVTLVISLCNDDPDVLFDIAKKYDGAGKLKNAVPILWHILQSLDQQHDGAIKLLKKHYGDSQMSSQLDNVTKTDTDFKVLSEFNGVCYGGSDGIYCSDFDGLIRYKISSASAISMSAASGGVYFLDSSDRCIKFLSADGNSCELVKKGIREFIYYNNYIYAIALDGTVSGSKDVALGKGESAYNLRVNGGTVECDVYDQSYNLLHTKILN